jgi:hypothetical protein
MYILEYISYNKTIYRIRVLKQNRVYSVLQLNQTRIFVEYLS